MTDVVTSWLSDSLWTYPLISVLVLLDITAVIPADAVVVAAAVLAGQGHLRIAFVYLSVIVGAACGDLILYVVGRRFGDRALRRIFRSEDNRRRLEWAKGQIRHHGSWILVPVRFVPVGRTATVFASGVAPLRLRTFVLADGAAILLYGAYHMSIGWFFGQEFQSSFWKPILIALGVAVVLGGVAEVVRRLVERGGDSGGGDGRESAGRRHASARG